MIDAAVAADDARRAAIARFEALRAEQNAHGKAVAKASAEEKAELVASAKALAESVKAAQAELSEAEATAKDALWKLPNVVIDGVPSGGEENFVTLKTVGESPSFPSTPSITSSLPRSTGLSTWSAGQRLPDPASTFWWV